MWTQCRRCGLQANTYRAIKDALRAGPIEYHDRFAPGLIERLDARKGPPSASAECGALAERMRRSARSGKLACAP